MPRKARFFIPKIPVHLVIRGNSRKTIFAEQEDYQFYRKWLLESKEEFDCEIYSYVLMTNFSHIFPCPAITYSDPNSCQSQPKFIH
ncbi:transposase [Candidatus Parabeggiatoa sp. HSG14]|uniref:transposase n=1 Tax=Candidatus Parabeggiatoa sp. HSG14 TaxID=3055593 RepID=UPI0025A8E881|nr:transposase [Thiotrichales bacterium HSG14]